MFVTEGVALARQNEEELMGLGVHVGGGAVPRLKNLNSTDKWHLRGRRVGWRREGWQGKGR